MCGSPDSQLGQALAALRTAMDAEPLSERVLDLTAQLAAALEAQQSTGKPATGTHANLHSAPSEEADPSPLAQK